MLAKLKSRWGRRQDLQSRNVDHDVTVRKIVQNVTISLIPEREISGQRQNQASNTTDPS